MKSKGTKSSELIRHKLYQSQLTELNHINNKTARELVTLKLKISKSKPILENIYDKIRLKEKNLQQKVINNQIRLAKAEERANKNVKLHEEAIRGIKSMGMDTLYSGRDNYPIATSKYAPAKAILEEFTKYRQRRQRNKEQSDIIPAQPPRPIRTQHTYIQYKQRLKNARNPYQQQQQEATNTTQLKQKISIVGQNIKSGIDMIKRVRKQLQLKDGRSLYSSKSRISKSETRLRMHFDQPSSRIDLERAQKFVESKQKRFHENLNNNK